jgi:hypothetical protein
MTPLKMETRDSMPAGDLLDDAFAQTAALEQPF